MKVLLEFIDANELTRSGAFTLRELQEKLTEMQPQEIAAAIKRLELERLITPSQHGEETAYELAHERMIPAVIKISGKILPQAYRANELLNKTVKIWMENDYSSRYLLGWETARNFVLGDLKFNKKRRSPNGQTSKNRE